MWNSNSIILWFKFFLMILFFILERKKYFVGNDIDNWYNNRNKYILSFILYV